MDFSISTGRSSATQGMLAATEVAPSTKAPALLQADGSHLQGVLEQQLSNGFERALQTFNGMTVRERDERLLGTLGWTAADHLAVADVLQVSMHLDRQQREQNQNAEARRDPVTDKLRFDPLALDRHAAVLLVAIMAMNVAKVSGVKMQGEFAILARAAAVAQGIATLDAGKAALYASLGTAVLGGGMAVAGGAVSLKGHSHNHSDIKSNLQSKHKLDIEVTSLKADLAARQKVVGAGPTTVEVKTTTTTTTSATISTEPGTREVSLVDHKNQLHADELSVLESAIRKKLGEASTLQMTSDLNRDGIAKKLQIGDAVKAMSMVFGQAAGAGLGILRSSAEQRGILGDADRSTHKAIADAAGQAASESGSLITKLLETLAALLRQRSDFVGHTARA